MKCEIMVILRELPIIIFCIQVSLSTHFYDISRLDIVCPVQIDAFTFIAYMFVILVLILECNCIVGNTRNKIENFNLSFTNSERPILTQILQENYFLRGHQNIFLGVK